MNNKFFLIVTSFLCFHVCSATPKKVHNLTNKELYCMVSCNCENPKKCKDIHWYSLPARATETINLHTEKGVAFFQDKQFYVFSPKGGFTRVILFKKGNQLHHQFHRK